MYIYIFTHVSVLYKADDPTSALAAASRGGHPARATNIFGRRLQVPAVRRSLVYVCIRGDSPIVEACIH